jgi:hypothetical protein
VRFARLADRVILARFPVSEAVEYDEQDRS